MTLPPGQRAVAGFPRFGTHLNRPAPQVPPNPVIEISGVLKEPVIVALTVLARLPRQELRADFHCVAGWSATDQLWEGVAFKAVYGRVVEPLLPPNVCISHVVFEGLDGYRSIVLIEDALRDDVLLAEHLGGRPLTSDHGAPARLVSPSQYGFISTKHLCRIELHTTEPPQVYHVSRLVQFGLGLVNPHRRARVWEEERHRYLPARLVRPVYRQLIPPIRALIARRIED